MRKVVLIAFGEDRPGIVSGVTEVLFNFKCNIEDSSMTILEGEFAIIMIVSLPKDIALDKFKNGFNAVEEKLGLFIALKELKKPPTIAEKIKKENIYIISVLGADKPGIVHKITKLLATQKINITDLNTKLIGKDGEKNVYAMVMEVDVPKEIKIDKFEADLKSTAKELGVDTTIKPVDSLKL